MADPTSRTTIVKQSFGQDYDYDNVGKSSTFRQGLPPSQIKDRKITSNRQDKQLPDNAIHTNKYNIFTFVPKNLFEQYSKIANVYFLLLGVLQIIPSVTNSDGSPTIWLPLFVINLATAAKDFYEDLKRKKSDAEENNSQTNLVTAVGDRKINWSELRVGDIIKVEKNEFFPADILIMQTSESKGECYIETKNLDGETNLKQKNVVSELKELYQNEEYVQNNIIFEYERPNPHLYKFNGRVRLMNKQKLSIDANNFILRGCSLRNTKYVIGLVSYTGHDTKIMMNSFQARAKQSHLEQEMSQNIILIFLLMVLICLFGSLYYLIATIRHTDEQYYLEDEDTNGAAVFFIQFFSWILNLSNLVPISLLVTLELVKMIQGMMITYDTFMVHQATQTPTQVQSSNLNEELGQVQYIFSDKTGTLTCNIMEFKKMSINGVSYGEVKKGQQNYADDISGFPKVTNVDFRDKQLFEAFNNESDEQHEPVLDNLRCLALCHTIITEKQENELVYNAASPDELALINFAKFCGVQYMGLDVQNNMEIKLKNQSEKYKLEHILEFNSTRKRMSVILKDPQQQVWLYTKGADSIIFDRMDKAKSTKIDETVSNLASYGTIGLRTLLLAKKQIPLDVYESWNEKYKEAISSLEKRDEKMEELQEELEKELVLVGATAIEDKLQDKVGETIDSMIKQGIKVWVLTGDKIETAINIAFSCKLITTDMTQIIVDEKEEQRLISALDNAMLQLSQADKVNIAFIISGDALIHGLKQTISKRIMQIGELAKAVVCCRVSPKQKQEIVSLVRREKPTVVTLAIGDGANDVNMITAAHVGIGIKGLEGAQAARASDYAIGEFKLLRRLLFYHGRESYRKNANLILFNFFKNTLLVMPQFWYGVYNYFSGPTFYDNYTYQFFNVFFASWPIMIYSIFDSEVKDTELIKNQMNYYDIGMKGQLFNKVIFWLCFLGAVIQSTIITYFSYLSCESNFTSPDGLTLNFWTSGIMVFGLVVLISNLKVLMISSDHSVGSVSIIVVSIVIYMIALLMSTNIQYSSGNIFNELEAVMTTANLHIGNILVLGMTSLMDMAVEWIRRWNQQSIRKKNYHIRLEAVLQEADEDIIIFTPIPKSELPVTPNANTNKKVKVNFINSHEQSIQFNYDQFHEEKAQEES